MTGPTINQEKVTGQTWPVNTEARNAGTEYGKLVDGQLDRLSINSGHVDNISNVTQGDVDAYAAANGYKPLVFATPCRRFAVSSWTETADSIVETAVDIELGEAKATAMAHCEYFHQAGAFGEEITFPCDGIDGGFVYKPGVAWATCGIFAGMRVRTGSGSDILLTPAQADAMRLEFASFQREQREALTAALSAIHAAETVVEVETAMGAYCRRFPNVAKVVI